MLPLLLTPILVFSLYLLSYNHLTHMKRFSFALVAALLLVACNQDELNSLLTSPNEQAGSIATINEQVNNINATIEDLKAADAAIGQSISSLQEEDLAIRAQLEADRSKLEASIDSLGNYVNGKLQEAQDWASATFATLEQYQNLCDSVAAVKQSLEALDARITAQLKDDLDSLETSMKAWVNERLTGYYTIAQMDAKVTALEKSIADGDEAQARELAELKNNLESAQNDIKAAYEKAISDAITTSEGKISDKIAADIQAATDVLQSQIDTINTKLIELEKRLSALETAVAQLIEMIQSIVVVPDYSDGSVIISNIPNNEVRFEVYPLKAAESLAKAGSSVLSLDYVETLTKSSGNFINLPVTSVSFDGTTLLLTVDGTGIPDTIIKGKINTASANARLKISDGINTRSSEFFPVYKKVNESQISVTGTAWVTETSATLFGWCYETGVEGASIEFGIEISDTDLSTHASSYRADYKGSDNQYCCYVSDLRPNKRYYYRAYTFYNGMRVYGEVKTFTTDGVPVDSVLLNITEYTINTIGGTFTLEATVLPAEHTDNSVYWSSDNESIVTVDQNGTVRAVSNGTATITVTTQNQGKTATCAITVAQCITEITLSRTSLTLGKGQERTLTAYVNPDNAVDKTLQWTSSDESVATVDQTGKVTAVSTGTATIRAEANDGGGTCATCSVTVSSIELDKTSLIIFIGETETITAILTPSSASNTPVTWTSSNSSVATVSSSGVVTGIGKGMTTITVTADDDSGVKATCEVEVKQYVTSITLSKTYLSLVVGEKETISITNVLPDNANDKTCTWSSSDNSVADVDQNGTITAKVKGHTVITAMANDGGGVYVSCEVRVMNPCPPGAVDLGVNVYWATRNLSNSGFVSSPKDSGDYYAWGETEPHYSRLDPLTWKDGKTGYDLTSYIWYDSSISKYTKYNANSYYYGVVDNKTELEDADDVAHVVLGGSWRMPTVGEWSQLIGECTWRWVTDYNGSGVNGCLVTGTNGNSIFLPASGYMSDNTFYAGAGRYWSSTGAPASDHPDNVSHMMFGPSNLSYVPFPRYLGLSIRPVCE